MGELQAAETAGRFYGQHGEDLLLAAMLEDVERGCFAEVGCIDGVRFSNTLHFEQRGWRGLCVEAHRDYIDLLRDNRPGSAVVHAVASARDAAEVTFFANRRGSLSSVDRAREAEFARRFGEYFTGYEEQKVPMRRLDSMLAEAGFAEVDLLSVDVEGHEALVLRGLGRYRPRIVLVESETPDHDAELDRLLWPLGYQLAFRLDCNLYYTRDEAVADRVRGRRFRSRLLHTGNPLFGEPDVETACELEVLGSEVWQRDLRRRPPTPTPSLLARARTLGAMGAARRAAGKALHGARRLRARARDAARDRFRTPRPAIRGALDPEQGEATFVVVAGPSFDPDRPRANESILLGYCHAFEELGVPYLIADVLDLEAALERSQRPFGLVSGHDLQHRWVTPAVMRALRRFPCAIWATPWFAGESEFYRRFGMPAAIWQWAPEHRKRVLESQPRMIFTGTTAGGLEFFETWSDHGVPVRSMPFAYDPKAYPAASAHDPVFEGIELAAVGNYWPSKSRQIDPYLRPWEDRLAIYGRTPWPYPGYRGPLPDGAEAPLFRQARVCPTINEPTVRLLSGQINERIFKVLGSGGLAAVDAIPAYRELFREDELFVPRNLSEFHAFVDGVLRDEAERRRWLEAGRRAVLDRHCYVHRARDLARHLGIGPFA